ncbi:hypothetical protein VST7929_02709 [Vibrio stylophorae]|uniref:NAD(P)/FAD-dependent oxidoreductase n=1 Tax=Vibrio stylophorae TaxID=659351 RepID=A0ABN8DWR7_9VIBR|nr:NAD(P)/FAD-dependent oxidoreductase [Vibrio stylophorae]CAH0534753.1 hypothetical protein VST7929_02709 [Vibrio stylophorae]
MQQQQVIIIGAGAAGLMCAATAGYRGKQVLVLDNAKQAGRKVLISGGGRCNFTNHDVSAHNYLCANPHFTKSALARFSNRDFIELVERHGIDYETRDHGQLFCLDSAKDIVNLLLTECEWAGAQIQLRTEILSITKHPEQGFVVTTSNGDYHCEQLVIATGGLSMPKLGATPLGYRIAEQFGMALCPTRAGLVPFTLHDHDKEQLAALSGIAVHSRITPAQGPSFEENLLFTHRGLSGPAILQVSSYWQAGQAISVDLYPQGDIETALKAMAEKHGNLSVKNALSRCLPKRLIEALVSAHAWREFSLKQMQHADWDALKAQIHQWQVSPNGTEGYRTAEVTLGGVDTDGLSSKTMESKTVPGLYFVGEVMDVTGWLGGYNFQWAWSSGYCCGLSL